MNMSPNANGFDLCANQQPIGGGVGAVADFW